MFSCCSNERKYPDNEVRVAVFIDPAGPFDYGYHDISKGEKSKVLDDIDQELWSKLCDYWPCPSKLQTTRYGSSWFYMMFLPYISVTMFGGPYAIMVTNPLHAGSSWSIFCVWTFAMFYSLKFVKRKIIEEFGPSTRDHIESLSQQFETEAGYFVDYGIDGSMAYARFQKLDRSDFEHPPTAKPCLLAFLLLWAGLVGFILFVVLLFCPLLLIMVSQLGSSGLEQQIKNSSAADGLDWPPVRFSQWTYYNPKYPHAQRVIFSSEQRAFLGMVDSDSMMPKLVPLVFAVLGYLFFLLRASDLCSCCSSNDITTLERQRKSIWSIGAAAACSCLLTLLSLVPMFELFENSPLCGPHFIELPFERRSSSKSTRYQFYGTDTILHEDIDVHCVLGKDVYWQLGLSVPNLLFFLIWFVKRRSYIRRQHLVAMTEANLSYYDRDDCELQEMHADGNSTDARSDLELVADDFEDEPSP